MKDIDLRGVILQHFYDHRKMGYLGVGVNDVPRPVLPSGCDEHDFARLAGQLAEHGYVEWKVPRGASHDNAAIGVGRITAAGVDVVEDDPRKATLPIKLVDQSQHHQHITISGSENVQVGGANSHFQQTVTQELERLIEAIEKSPVPDPEKKDALAKLGTFLGTSAANSAIGIGVKLLLEKCHVHLPS